MGEWDGCMTSTLQTQQDILSARAASRRCSLLAFQHSLCRAFQIHHKELNSGCKENDGSSEALSSFKLRGLITFWLTYRSSSAAWLTLEKFLSKHGSDFLHFLCVIVEVSQTWRYPVEFSSTMVALWSSVYMSGSLLSVSWTRTTTHTRDALHSHAASFTLLHWSTVGGVNVQSSVAMRRQRQGRRRLLASKHRCKQGMIETG